MINTSWNNTVHVQNKHVKRLLLWMCFVTLCYQAFEPVFINLFYFIVVLVLFLSYSSLYSECFFLVHPQPCRGQDVSMITSLQYGAIIASITNCMLSSKILPFIRTIDNSCSKREGVVYTLPSALCSAEFPS